MKSSLWLSYAASIIAISSLITSCGSDGGSIAGIDRSGSRTTSGPIEGFGSVIINGVHYSTENADIFVSGEPGREEDLRAGDYITVLSNLEPDNDSGSAEQIYYQPNVIGPVSNIDQNAEQFVILGQTIQVDEETSFDIEFSPRSILGISQGDTLVVSGASNGSLVFATRIHKQSTTLLEVSGRITSLDTNTMTFRLDQQLVNFANSGFSGILSNEERVVVQGNQLAQGTLNATNIRFREEDLLVIDGREIEVDGYISGIQNGNDIFVGDLRISLNTNTIFNNGSRDDVSDNQRVRIQGLVSSEGQVLAQQITFIQVADSRLSGLISDIEIITGNENTRAIITINEQAVVITHNTRLDDKESDLRLGRLELGDLRLGDTVVVAGRYERDQLQLIASTLERESQANSGVRPIEIQGIVEIFSLDDQVFELFGYTVSLLNDVLIIDGDSEISPAEFFNIVNGSLVEVTGRTTDNQMSIEANLIRVVRRTSDEQEPNTSSNDELIPEENTIPTADEEETGENGTSNDPTTNGSESGDEITTENNDDIAPDEDASLMTQDEETLSSNSVDDSLIDNTDIDNELVTRDNTVSEPLDEEASSDNILDDPSINNSGIDNELIPGDNDLSQTPKTEAPGNRVDDKNISNLKPNDRLKIITL